MFSDQEIMINGEPVNVHDIFSINVDGSGRIIEYARQSKGGAEQQADNTGSQQCQHWGRSTDGVHVVVIDKCYNPDCLQWAQQREAAAGQGESPVAAEEKFNSALLQSTKQGGEPTEVCPSCTGSGKRLKRDFIDTVINCKECSGTGKLLHC